MASPRAKSTKAIEKPYPAFPVKKINPPKKGTRVFPVETPAEFGTRLSVMAAYQTTLFTIQKSFTDNRKSFRYNGMDITRVDIRSLLSQSHRDVRSLKGFFTSALAAKKSKGRGNSGYKLLSIISPKMFGFLSGVNFGPLYTSAGMNGPLSDVLKSPGNFLDDKNPYRGIVGQGVISTLLAIYIHYNGLVGTALHNQGKARADWKGSWIGADDLMRTTFAQEFAVGKATSEAHQQKYGEVVGQARKYRSNGQPAAQPTPGKPLPDAKTYYVFSENDFRWQDVHFIYTPNTTKEVNKYTDIVSEDAAKLIFPKTLSIDQSTHMAAYNKEVAKQLKAKVVTVDYLVVAMAVTGTATTDMLMNTHPYLFVRARNDANQFLTSTSNDLLQKAL